MPMYSTSSTAQEIENIVGTTETAIAGISCEQFGTFRLKFHCQLHFGEPLDTEIFQQERRLAVDKGIGRLTLVVKRAVPVRWCIVWSPKTKVITSGGKRQLFFFFS
jgi:hypothetical protein